MGHQEAQANSIPPRALPGSVVLGFNLDALLREGAGDTAPFPLGFGRRNAVSDLTEILASMNLSGSPEDAEMADARSLSRSCTPEDQDADDTQLEFSRPVAAGVSVVDTPPLSDSPSSPDDAEMVDAPPIFADSFVLPPPLDVAVPEGSHPADVAMPDAPPLHKTPSPKDVGAPDAATRTWHVTLKARPTQQPSDHLPRPGRGTAAMFRLPSPPDAKVGHDPR